MIRLSIKYLNILVIIIYLKETVFKNQEMPINNIYHKITNRYFGRIELLEIWLDLPTTLNNSIKILL